MFIVNKTAENTEPYKKYRPWEIAGFLYYFSKHMLQNAHSIIFFSSNASFYTDVPTSVGIQILDLFAFLYLPVYSLD